MLLTVLEVEEGGGQEQERKRAKLNVNTVMWTAKFGISGKRAILPEIPNLAVHITVLTFNFACFLSCS